MLKAEIDFREVLSRIKEFALFSGLQINKAKSKAFCPGYPNYYGDRLMGIEMVSQLQLLGVHFSCNKTAKDLHHNWLPKIKMTEKRWEPNEKY